jgi:hypothetical protein
LEYHVLPQDQPLGVIDLKVVEEIKQVSRNSEPEITCDLLKNKKKKNPWERGKKICQYKIKMNR